MGIPSYKCRSIQISSCSHTANIKYHQTKTENGKQSTMKREKCKNCENTIFVNLSHWWKWWFSHRFNQNNFLCWLKTKVLVHIHTRRELYTSHHKIHLGNIRSLSSISPLVVVTINNIIVIIISASIRIKGSCDSTNLIISLFYVTASSCRNYLAFMVSTRSKKRCRKCPKISVQFKCHH